MLEADIPSKLERFGRGKIVEVVTRSHGTILNSLVEVLGNSRSGQPNNRQIKVRVVEPNPAGPRQIMMLGGGTWAREIDLTTLGS